MPTYDSERGYDLYACEYRKDHAHLDSFDWDVAGVWWKQAVQECVLANSRAAVLDAGCGDGRTLARWSKWIKTQSWADSVDLYGVDASQNMLREAAKRAAGVKWAKLDLADVRAVERWVQAHTEVDVLSSFFVSVHFANLETFFDVHARLVRPEGQFLMNVIPQRQAPILRANGKQFTIRAFHHDAEDAQRIALDRGWELVRRHQAYEDDRLVSTLFRWKRLG